MAVASMHLGVWSWSRQSPELQTECQEKEATICKSSPKLDSWRLEKCCLVWWVSISVE